MRQQGISLGKISEMVVEECLGLERVSKPCYDNVTLLIISLQDYLIDYERRSVQGCTP